MIILKGKFEIMKRALMFLLVICMVLAVGCRGGGEFTYSNEYGSEIVVQEIGDGDAGKEDSNKNNTDNDENVITTSKFKPSSNGKIKVDGSVGKDKDANYNIKGKVTVAVSSYRPTDYEAMFDAMTQVYKDIEITIDYRPQIGSDLEETTHYLTARALADNMPDVLFDDAGTIWSHIVNGWVEPLDKYVANDTEFSNVPESIKSDYTYGGKLYALPHQAHYSAMVINLDALNAMKLKKPSLNWNLTDYSEFLKNGTNSVYSGCEILSTTSSYLAGSYDNSVTLYGYDYRNHNFEKIPSTYRNSFKLHKDLQKIKGLEAYGLRFTQTDGVSDYIAKFGKGNVSNMAMAFHMGKTLLHLDQGTWGLDVLDENDFKWQLWPYPQYIAGNIPIHIDCCYMLKAAQNKDVAFQVLRYMTYSTEGNLARLSMYDKVNEGKYSLNSRIFYPICSDEKVGEKFKSLPMINEVDIYWYNNTKNGYRVDPEKFIPGWELIAAQVIGKISGCNSEKEFDAIMPSIISSGKTFAKAQQENFNAKLKIVQANE